MKSILKRRNNNNGGGGSASTLAQPSTASSESVVEIVAEEDARLSTVPWSAVGGQRSTSVPADARRDARPPVRRLQQAADEWERDVDLDLRLVDEDLRQIERRLDGRFQQYDRRLRSSQQPLQVYCSTLCVVSRLMAQITA